MIRLERKSSVDASNADLVSHNRLIWDFIIMHQDNDAWIVVFYSVAFRYFVSR